nr:hypothetical protein [Tanacetum cinerariifolium]
MSLLQEALDGCVSLARRVEHLEHDKVAQDLEIIKLKTRVKMLERANKGRMIDELDRDEGDVLMSDEEKKKAEEVKDITGDAQVKERQADIYQIDIDHAAKVLSVQEDEPEVQEAVEVVTTAKLITEVVAAISKTVSAAVVPAATEIVAPVKVDTPTETKSKDKGKGIMVEEPKPMNKKQQVELDEVYANMIHGELNQDIDWDVAIDHVKQKAKEDPFIQRYQVMKKRPQTEAQARRNMMMYLKNTVGFRLDYFKGMSYDDIQATPLGRKVPIVDYQIIHFNNKPHYKIIRADGTPQLYRRLRVTVEHSQGKILYIKVNNFSDDFLLTTLKAMFGKPDRQDQIWKSQRSVHGQAMVKSWKLLESCGVHIITFTTTQMILLVERRYPLLRFTLDQMINTMRLQVEEQSEMSLELIRFTRQQLQKGQHNAARMFNAAKSSKDC